MSEQTPPTHDASVATEPDHVALGWVFAVFVTVVAVIALASGMLHWGLSRLKDGTTASGEAAWQQLREGAGVAPNQGLIREQQEAQQRRWLNTYGWQDAAHHVARIPIREAMKRMVKQKLEPPWTTVDAQTATSSTATSSTMTDTDTEEAQR